MVLLLNQERTTAGGKERKEVLLVCFLLTMSDFQRNWKKRKKRTFKEVCSSYVEI